MQVGDFYFKLSDDYEHGKRVTIRCGMSEFRCYVHPDIVLIRDGDGCTLPISHTLFPELRECIDGNITKSMLEDYFTAVDLYDELSSSIYESGEVDESRFTCNIVRKVTRVLLNGTNIFAEFINGESNNITLYHLKYSMDFYDYDSDVFTPLNLMNLITTYTRLLGMSQPLKRAL